VENLLFGHKNHKNNLQVTLGDLKEEKDNLFSFLLSNLKVKVEADQDIITIDSETISPQDLLKAVTKFVYRRNLNGTHWVSLEDNVVRINRFNSNTKKKEKPKKNAAHQTITQSWGL
jgi:hypothetical protein